jgi:uncharacterized protein (TIGR00369 family)
VNDERNNPPASPGNPNVGRNDATDDPSSVNVGRSSASLARHGAQAPDRSKPGTEPGTESGTESGLGPGDAFAYAPISRLIGLEVLPGGPGEAEVALNVGPTMHNPMGAVHGGVIALLADAAMGIAFGRTLVDQASFATVEMKVSYLRPVTATRLTARATVVARGLRIGFAECTITDSRSREVARASCTCTVNSLSS